MDFVNIEINRKIATLTFSNPSKLNALSKGLVDELIQALKICAKKKARP